MNLDKPKLVLWSPHRVDEFIVVSSSLRLFQCKSSIQAQPEPTTSSSRISVSVDQSPQPPVSVSGSPTPPTRTKPSIAITNNNTSNASPSANNPANTGNGTAASPFKLLDTVTYPQQSIKAAAWCTDSASPQTVGVGLLSGKLALIRFREDVRIVKEFDPRYQRTCHALAWNPIHTNKIAVGLDRVRQNFGALIWDVNARGMLGNASNAAPSAPILNANTMSITANTSQNVPVETVTEALLGVGLSEASLSMSWWPLDPHVLAVGTGFKWLRFFDTRANANREKPLSVVAHTKSVLGCRYDPFNPYRIATYGEDGVVKVWDPRMLPAVTNPQANSPPVYQLSHATNKSVKAKPLVEMDWCATSPGVLATISRDEYVVKLWDLSGALPLPITDADSPTHTDSTAFTNSDPSTNANTGKDGDKQQAPSGDEWLPRWRTVAGSHSSSQGPLSSFSWHPSYKQRLLTVTKEGHVQDVSLHDTSIAIFDCHNRLLMALDDRLIVMTDFTRTSTSTDGDTETDGDHDSAGDSAWQVLSDDIASVMERRAKCGYALDITVNKRLIAIQARDEELQRLWTWMSHQQATLNRTHSHTSSNSNDGSNHNQQSASDTDPFAGVVDVLLPPDAASDDQRKSYASHHIGNPHNIPSIQIYISDGRQRALHSCGWFDTLTPLSSTVTRKPGSMSVDSINYESYLRTLEERGEFERAAMIAVFHLDLKRALMALNAGAERNANLSESGSGERSDIDLNLVALALAGYQSSHTNTNTNTNVVNSNSQLWQRPFAATLSHRRLSAELKAIFSFLSLSHTASRGSLSLYHSLLSFQTPLLSMRDRLAFACRFLPDNDLQSFVKELISDCIHRGNLDGLMLTGLNDRHGGVRLMQSYIDRTSDLQTVALLACYGYVSIARAPQSSTHTQSIEKFNQWVALYRAMLNQWQLWTERAKLDVARALLHQRHSTTNASSKNGNSVSTSMQSSLSNLLPNVSPQVYARCTFCSQPLHCENLSSRSALSQRMAARRGKGDSASGGAASGDSSVSVMGCPHCKQPLPRCALCLVSMDVRMGPPPQPINATKSSLKASLSSSKLNESVMEFSVVDSIDNRFDSSSWNEFGRWFSWCQRCRHGGHAGHMQQWFDQHKVCPVHDCNCHCTSYG